jgi:cytochrome c oxidase assembly factor CtaG/cytochrome c2
MRVAGAAAIVLGWAEAAAAHQGSHAPAATGPSGWDLLVLLALAGGGLLYAAGSWRLASRGARVRPIERAAFWAGWLALVAAAAPPLDVAAASLLSMHMVQHELLMLAGAPLMIVGRPIVPWLWALPDRLRPIAGAGLQSRQVGSAWAWLTTPGVAWALHGATVWVWHAPVLYEAAVASEALHLVQHVTFVATSVLFWWGLVYGRYGRAAYGASALYVFTTMVHTGILGALFALSTSPYYGVYRDRAAAAGVDATTDQQLAGMYMWIPGGVILTLFGLALLMAWLSESDRRAARRRHVIGLLLSLMASGGVAACRSGIPYERDVRQLTGGDPHSGRQRIAQYGCDTCHTIPGIPTADATVGPPLAQVARRVYLAGHIENTPENMMRWIQHPRAHDARTAMPELGVSDQDSRDITAYLYTLR